MQVVLFQQIMKVPKGKFIHLLDVLFTKTNLSGEIGLAISKTFVIIILVLQI